VLCLLRSVLFKLKLRRLEIFRPANTALTTDLLPKTPIFIQHNLHQIYNHNNHVLRILLPSIPCMLARKGIVFLEESQPGVGYLEVGDLLFLLTTPLPKATLQKHDTDVSSSSYTVPGYYNGYNIQMMQIGMQKKCNLVNQCSRPSLEWVIGTCTSGQLLFQMSPCRNTTMTIYKC
jgi:hypothetical protein